MPSIPTGAPMPSVLVGAPTPTLSSSLQAALASGGEDDLEEMSLKNDSSSSDYFDYDKESDESTGKHGDDDQFFSGLEEAADGLLGSFGLANKKKRGLNDDDLDDAERDRDLNLDIND
ncbi:hypothetical protein SEMRO_3294_G346310.1 [Seminavis robusta]|uniref:Uncharacterized protein n=1 Tax=Seminavis robusta TaxID=568900 RepID=A0A9N8HZZ8_9STRA|nr:hypothetical protein SEMRO_3294_G346310.1 [Seminavis robusta]|eukprot:Sro3294_g346310.1 n/a (118) ;mRNA; r:6341-6694